MMFSMVQDGMFYGFLGLTMLTMLTAATVTVLKGRLGLFLLGFPLGLPWIAGALRLARPGSWWARRFYDRTEVARAVTRHGTQQPQFVRPILFYVLAGISALGGGAVLALWGPLIAALGYFGLAAVIAAVGLARHRRLL